MRKTSKLCGIRSRQEKCRNACASVRTQRRLVQVAWRHRKTHQVMWTTKGSSSVPVILSRCRRKKNISNHPIWNLVCCHKTEESWKAKAHYYSDHLLKNARSMTTTRLTKAKGGLSPISLVAIPWPSRQQEVQKHRRARVHCQLFLHQPFLCIWAVYRCYRQHLLSHKISLRVAREEIRKQK